MVDVSVWITTYNHEQFIAEAIESVLMQQTAFTYDIVIGEDCSTDNTREIVLRYKAQYPDKIRLLLPDTNLGMIPMTRASYPLCTGRYIAWLDGDDYWTDPYKLQQQVSFLEAHPAYSFCFHQVIRLDTTTGSRVESGDPEYKGPDNTLYTNHFIHIYNPVYALSVVHRNVLNAHSLNWIFTLPYPDWGFYLALLQHGQAKYMSQLMGIYRIHKDGAYSGQSFDYNGNQIINLFTLTKPFFNKQYDISANRVIKYYYKKLFAESLRQRQLRKVIKYVFLILANS